LNIYFDIVSFVTGLRRGKSQQRNDSFSQVSISVSMQPFTFSSCL